MCECKLNNGNYNHSVIRIIRIAPNCIVPLLSSIVFQFCLYCLENVLYVHLNIWTFGRTDYTILRTNKTRKLNG